MMEREKIKSIIMDSIIEDDIGLYEAFWVVPDGNLYDHGLKAGKAISWTDAVSIVMELLRERRCCIYFLRSKGRIVSLELKEIEGVVADRVNWEPFNISKGPGYILTES